MVNAIPERILYVEDDALAARLLQKRLNRAGYEVDLAADGEEGLSKWLSGSYSLLALDHDMPKKKGLEVIRELAARGPLPPALMITGHGNEMVAVEAMKLGADDYIIKDTEAGYLDLVPHRIEEALARRRMRQESLRMEDELKVRTEMFSRVFQTAPYIMIVVDREGRVKNINRAGVDFSRKPEIELLGLQGGEVFNCLNAADSHECGTWEECALCPVRQRIRHTFRTGESIYNEEARLLVRSPSGQTAFDMLISTALIQAEGESMVLVTIADMTGRKQAESERLLLATAIEQASESVEITDSNHEIAYVNPAYERISGYARQELIGQKANLLATEMHHPSLYEDIWKAIEEGKTWAGTLVSRKKDGTLFQEEVTISPVRDKSGEIVNFVAVKRDVTNEVMLEQELLETQRTKAMGTLAGGIAHDFNTLLQVINGYADMALLDVREGQPGHFELLEIRQAGKTAADLTRGLLSFSRRVESKPRPLDLNTVIPEVARMLKRTLPKVIDIRLNLAKAMDMINADPGQIRQLVVNLCVNARDAMPKGGRITIDTRNVYLSEECCKSELIAEPGNYVLLSIAHTGVGMDACTRERMFDPFFTSRMVGNTGGLGLSVVLGIVKSHGGNIVYHSGSEEGSAFNMYFPALPVM